MLKMRYSQVVTKYGNAGTISDRKKSFYEGLGYTGSLRDMEIAWLAAQGSTTGTLSDRWKKYLIGAGSLTDKVIAWAGR